MMVSDIGKKDSHLREWSSPRFIPSHSRELHGGDEDAVYRRDHRRMPVKPPANGKSRGRLKVIVVSVAVVLFLAILPFWISAVLDSGGGNGGDVRSLDSFMGGSSRILLNTTYTGADAYLTLPSNARVEKASVTISGSLPPQRINFQAGRNPIDIAVGDIDGDTFTDVVVANYKDASVLVMRNHGKGLQASGSYEVGKGPIRVELAELNGDGYPDLIVLSEDSRDIRFLMNDQIGGFKERGEPYRFSTLPADLAVLDIDSDGDNDTAVISSNDNNLTLFINDGNGDMIFHSWIRTEGGPSRIAVTDYDLDGREDLVISNRRDVSGMNGERHSVFRNGRMIHWLSTVSFWRNRGNFSFVREMEDLRVQKGVSSMDCGDINGDGYPDVVMSNLGYHNVSIIRSDGSGGMIRKPPKYLDATLMGSMDPIKVKLIDIDRDGDLDIMALTKSADSILLYTGNGKGDFHNYIQYYVGTNPTSFDLMDYDSDGDLDVVTSDWKGCPERNGENGTVSVLINLRSGIFGTYSQYPTGNSPRGVFAEDLDGDGDVEIAAANYFGSTISILKNDGIGGFSEPREYPIGLEPYAVVLADFDGDGRMDGASADEANFRIVLLQSDGKGGFTTDRFLYDIGAYPFSLRTGDIDGDGDIDLFTSNYFQNSTTLLFNDGSGNFSTMFNEHRTVYLGTNMPYDSLIGDINGDGLKDLVTVNRGDSIDPSDTISVMINDGTYTFGNMITYRVGKEPTSAVVWDLDNDGDIDIATANTGDDSVSVMLNNGRGVLEKLGDFPAGDRPQYINVMDFDDDGLTDLLVTNTDSNDLILLRNIGGGEMEGFQDLNIASYPYAIETADFNSDGRDDVVISAVNTNSVVVFGCYWYPENVSVDVGADGTIEMSYDGLVTDGDHYQLDIADAVNAYLREHPSKGEVRIPLRVTAGKEGVVSLSDLLVIWR